MPDRSRTMKRGQRHAGRLWRRRARRAWTISAIFTILLVCAAAAVIFIMLSPPVEVINAPAAALTATATPAPARPETEAAAPLDSAAFREEPSPELTSDQGPADPPNTTSAPTATPSPISSPTATPSPAPTATPSPALTATSTPVLTPAATPSPIYSPTATPKPVGTPRAVPGTEPAIAGLRTRMNLDGINIDSYARAKPFAFGAGNDYAQLEGVVTFRNDHWRQGATYGTADVIDKKLSVAWSVATGSLPKATRASAADSWTGSGWTGQPIIVRWPESTRKIMNLIEDKKQKEGLVEVIYPTMDGNIYFIDLESGEKTREKIDIGLPFKGSGSLDPRGYPLYYLGAGDAVPAHNGKPAMKREFFIYSLITGKRLFSFGKADPFAPRAWDAYDSSALVDAATDTLIAPGENGILYMMKLNAQFDPDAGTVSVEPNEFLKFAYDTERTRAGAKKSPSSYWLGMEGSAVMWNQWLYIADNGGNFFCLDTQTMEIVWMQNVLDDSNSTPVLEEDNGHPYLYISTSLHWTAKNGRGDIPIWKIDGLTGEIIWETRYPCHTVSGISGGVEGTGLLGTGDISHLVVYPVARTPSQSNGVLVALNKETGKEEWKLKMNFYTWSSPVAIKDASGKTYIVICDSNGQMFLLDGLTGEKLSHVDLGANVEASPAVFNDMIVVGTRGRKIFGVKVS